MWKITEDVIAAGSDERAGQAVQAESIDPDEFRARIAYLYAHPDLESREHIKLKDGRTIDRYRTPIRRAMARGTAESGFSAT